MTSRGDELKAAKKGCESAKLSLDLASYAHCEVAELADAIESLIEAVEHILTACEMKEEERVSMIDEEPAKKPMKATRITLTRAKRRWRWDVSEEGGPVLFMYFDDRGIELERGDPIALTIPAVLNEDLFDYSQG